MVVRRVIVRVIVFFLVAAGSAVMWQYKQPASRSAFIMHIPPTVPEPTREQILRLPNSDEYLRVSLMSDGSVDINNSIRFEGAEKYSAVGMKLKESFDQGVENRVLDSEVAEREDLPIEKRVAREVVIVAPTNAKYGEVVLLIDAVKNSGFDQMWIQIDGDNYWWEMEEFLNLVNGVGSNGRLSRRTFNETRESLCIDFYMHLYARGKSLTTLFVVDGIWL